MANKIGKENVAFANIKIEKQKLGSPKNPISIYDVNM